jgi:hypothetical protein
VPVNATKERNAMSDLQPVDYRPRKSRIGAWFGAIVFAGSFIALSFTLGVTTPGGGAVHPADHAAMIGIGLIGAGLILVFLRLRVRADAEGIEVRNIIRTTRVPWAVVEDVSLPRRMQWAVLTIADDEEIPILAVQASDKERAAEAIRGLRAWLEASRQR